jgi:hypothetical protein
MVLSSSLAGSMVTPSSGVNSTATIHETIERNRDDHEKR